MSTAESGNTVRVHYSGRLEDGTVFDSSEGSEPLEFVVGKDMIIPGLEKEIVGMGVGDTKTINVACDEAYGPRQDDAVQVVPREEIPAEIQLEVGGRLQASTPEGQQMLLTVVELTDTEATLDANHPLAGKDLVFDIEMVEIS